MDFYAGVGSRDTPPNICKLMRELAALLADDGMTLRSGHARGADQAFESGARGQAQIFLPWPGFERAAPLGGVPFSSPSPEAYELAEKFHPSWHGLAVAARFLHARNCHEVLGPDLDDPVEFIICWTKGGRRVGGTAQAIRIANAYDIPVYNLARSEHLRLAMEWVERGEV